MPTLTPVDFDPFKSDGSEPKLTLVDGNPFEEKEPKLTAVNYDPFDQIPSSEKMAEAERQGLGHPIEQPTNQPENTWPSNLSPAPSSLQKDQGTSVLTGKPLSGIERGSADPGRGIVGLAESIPAMATGLPAFIVGTPAKLGNAALNTIQGVDKPFTQAIKDVDNLLRPYTYEPKTEEGVKATKGLTYGAIAATAPYLLPMLGVSEALDTDTAKQYLSEEQISKLKIANDALMLVAPAVKESVRPTFRNQGGINDWNSYLDSVASEYETKQSKSQKDSPFDLGPDYKPTEKALEMATRPEVNAEAETLTAGELRPGDSFTRSGEEFKVESISPLGTVKLADGEKFDVKEGQTILADKGSVKLGKSEIESGEEKLYAFPGDIEKISQDLKKFKDEIYDPVKSFWARAPQITEEKLMRGKYLGDVQQYNWRVSQFAKAINKEYTPLEQKAIKRWMQAGGDETKLKEWSSQIDDPALKKVYDAAASLSPRAKELAKQLEVSYHEAGTEAIKEGILEDLVDNYVNKNWDRPNKASQKLSAWANAVSTGTLKTNPREAMHRIFESNFEGEKLGFREKDDTIGYAYAKYMSSMAEAKASREYLKKMMTAKMEDGRPMVYVGGAGFPVPKEGMPESILVKPNAKPQDVYDYKEFNHPALRKWKWISEVDGKPVLMQGNMLIHPKAYSKINSLLGVSKIKTFTVPESIPIIGGTRPGAAALKVSNFIKGSVLVGPFHQAHVGEHALFHGVNPLRPGELNLDNPKIKSLVDHGLMIFNHDGLAQFGEGLHGGGIFHWLGRIIKESGQEKLSEKNPFRKITDRADFLQQYGEYLFQDYIPRLKSEMALKAVERAEKWYAKDLETGKLTMDQLLDNVAKQSNAAFGEQNYRYIGRNQTLQDGLRLVFLAPDFLESRFKFAGQALRPYGREQQKAFLKGAIIMAVTTQTINTLFGDDNAPDWKHPFTVKIDGREYSPRSVMADMWHLASDPRGFWYHRLNPLYVRPGIEIASGKNISGQKMPTEEILKDIMKSWTPIPAQGFFKDNMGDSKLSSILNSIFASIGISNYDAKTDAERKIREIYANKLPIGGKSDREREKYNFVKDMQSKFRDGEVTISGIRAEARKADVMITSNDIKRIVRPKDDPNRIKDSIKGMKVDEALEVWKVANDSEKLKIKTLVLSKIANSQTITPKEKRQLRTQVLTD